MKKHTRISALVFAVLFLVFTAISLTVILMEANHDCVGEDCPICAQLAALQAIVRSIAALLVILVAILLVIAVKGQRFVSCIKLSAPSNPVALKVRLLN